MYDNALNIYTYIIHKYNISGKRHQLVYAAYLSTSDGLVKVLCPSLHYFCNFVNIKYQNSL